jgi:phosphate transport system substrate-binding protein
MFSQNRRRGKRQITNWATIGGPNASIVTFAMSNTTSADNYLGNFYTRSLLQGSTWAKSVTLLPDGDAIVKAVAENEYALGLVDMSHINTISMTVRVVALKSHSDPTSAATRATPVHLCQRTFPLARVAYLYAHHQPHAALNPMLAEFIKFVLSLQGQVRFNVPRTLF